jgi:hypothetical protein
MPPKSTQSQRLLQGVYIGVAIGLGLTVTDALRESLGRLGALGVGIVVGLLVAWAAQTAVSAWQRRAGGA